MSDFYLLEHDTGKPFQYGRTRRNGGKPTGTCVVHTAENTIDLTGRDDGAEDVARFIARRATYGSYHFLCDSDSLIFMAPANYEVWHDTATNNFSYGGSMAVQADKWDTIPKDRRDKIVRNCAAGFASFAKWLMDEHGITVPAKRITRAQAHRGVPGFLGHGESDPARRHDPGAEFDWELFLSEFARLTGQAGSVKPSGSLKPKPKPSGAKHVRVQTNSTRPNGSTTFPTDYEDLLVDKDFGEFTVGALQILLHALKRWNNGRWDGDFEDLTVEDFQEQLRAMDYYKVTPFAARGVRKGVRLKVDGADGYWFWVEVQRMLADRGFYPRDIDGDPKGWTIRGLQLWLNDNNGR
ncbi:N-acetylmuramoyl-L-alanine amidase [Arthrobacter sp. JSM 101049]|uniref:peptidoglycan recognition protein family protein n=1 Tax=Arthrobacter sp. JSM 101049 TaxID=929097 RepID=UPI00356A1A2A